MATPATITYARLAVGTYLSNSVAGTLYTAPAGQMGAQVTSFLLVNTGTVSASAFIYVIPSGQSLADHFFLAKAITVPADGYPLDVLKFVNGNMYIGASDKLQGSASVASAVTFHLCGAELS